jgi:predicted DNA-binding mobile mystery protein A
VSSKVIGAHSAKRIALQRNNNYGNYACRSNKELLMANSSTPAEAFQARVALDSRLNQMQQAARLLTRPRSGWIQTIRSALGMSATDLAQRLSVAPSTVIRMESSEIEGTINIETLQRVADSLGCSLVYALVPKSSLESSVKHRALKIARHRLSKTQQTMVLEQQAIAPGVLQKLVEREAENLMRIRGLWKDDVDIL